MKRIIACGTEAASGGDTAERRAPVRGRKRRPRIFMRMLLAVICSIVLSIGLCSAAIYLYLEPMLKRSIISGNEAMVQKMLQQVSGSLEDISRYATSISFDEQIKKALTTPETAGVYQRYSNINRMEKKLHEYVLLRDNLIYDIYVVDNDRQVLEMTKIYGDLVREPLYATALGGAAPGVTSPHTVRYNSSGGQWETMAYIGDIYDTLPPYRRLGKLAIMLNISELTRPILFDPQSGIDIELHHQQVGKVYGNNSARDLVGELQNAGGGTAGHLYRQELGDSGWYAVYSISDQHVTESFRAINAFIIGIAASCMLVMLLLVGKIVSRIVQPLETLVRGMHRVSGGSRTERITVDTDDEIADAAAVFNQMVADIDDHTQMLLDSEKKEHETQLKMLLYQINPHFIYNTLNCVICLARKGDCAGIVALTKVFITLLRTILRVDAKSMTTLREEILYMNHYVSVLQFSYDNVRDLVWEVDESLLDIRLPKLILYPLVENSIFYGVLPVEGESKVSIQVARDGGGVRVRVADSGNGMRPEELELVRRSLAGDGGAEERDHIGISNVNRRLVLIYGRRAALDIESEPGTGTVVQFYIDENIELA